MKLLIVTNLFPNAREPNRSTFNFQQFLALARLCKLKVVAPLPCFQYSLKQVPRFEMIGGIDVFHPRYLVIPKILRWSYPVAFFIGIWHTLKLINQLYPYDVILAAWAYPDAVGTAVAARLLRKKFFVKVQGSDINLAHQYWGRAWMITWALGQADKVIAVSRPLKDKLVAMGIAPEKVVVIPNGVDKAKFYPRNKSECRKSLGLAAGRKYILYVGNLADVKGVEYLIRALKGVQDAQLLLIGDGPLRHALEALAKELGVQDRVVFKGRQPYADIPVWLNAADVLCLPSLNEGCPNVVLEAMACGIPVVATRVGGIPDIIDTPEKGWLVEPKDPDSLAKSLGAALNAPVTALKADIPGWDESAEQVLETLLCKPGVGS